MENLIHKYIEQNVKGVDTYQHDGSTWLIFTDDKKWVIELTKDGTLWYNYNFFNSIFIFFSLDVIENQHYITKWVEDTIQNGVRYTGWMPLAKLSRVEDTIQNGVRHTHCHTNALSRWVEDTIQNGLRHTRHYFYNRPTSVEDTIQNGVRHTIKLKLRRQSSVEDTIQNGVRHTGSSMLTPLSEVGNVIQNGVRSTLPEKTTCSPHLLEDIVQNGLKNTKVRYNWTVKNVENTIQNGVKRTCNTLIDMESIEHTIQNGIKNTKAGGYLGPITIRGKVFHQFESSNRTDNVDEVVSQGEKY